MHPTHDVVHLHSCLRSPSYIPDTTDSFTQCVSSARTRLSILGLAGGNAGAVEKRPFIKARNKLAFILLFPAQPHWVQEVLLRAKKPQDSQGSKLKHHWRPWVWPCRATTTFLLGHPAMAMSLSLGCVYKKGVRVQPQQHSLARSALHGAGGDLCVPAHMRRAMGPWFLLSTGGEMGSASALLGAACQDKGCPVSGSAAPTASLPVQERRSPSLNWEPGRKMETVWLYCL